jgi:hypothetical protein
MRKKMRDLKIPFHRYDDARHWGLFIPVSRKKKLSLYDVNKDTLRDPAIYRMHLCIVLKIDRFHCLRMCEIRLRIGFQYL